MIHTHLARRDALAVLAKAIAISGCPSMALAAAAPSSSDKVYMGFTLAELEAAVDPKVGTPNWRQIMATWQQLSQQARVANPPRTYAYGAHERTVLDVHAKDLKPGAPALLFFHGGGWRLGSKEDMSFIAPVLNRAGIAYIAPNYPLAPLTSVAKMLPSTRDAAIWVYRNADVLGIDRNRIFIGGLSAGGHIAAYLMTTRWEDFGLPQAAFKGGVLVSGAYDMTPMKKLRSYDYLGLLDNDLVQVSPINHVCSLRAPVIVSWAEFDPPVFRNQGKQLADKARAVGIPVEVHIDKGKNHFQLPLALASDSTALFRMVKDMILRSV